MKAHDLGHVSESHRQRVNYKKTFVSKRGFHNLR